MARRAQASEESRRAKAGREAASVAKAAAVKQEKLEALAKGNVNKVRQVTITKCTNVGNS